MTLEQSSGCWCFQIASIEDLLDARNSQNQVLFVQIQLALEQRNLEGYVAFVLGDSSLLNLQQAISHFLDGTINP